MGMADSSRRVRVGDIELAYRITGRGKPVILIRGNRGDSAGHVATLDHQVIPGFPCLPVDIRRH
jgi:hypothetical protein